MDVSSHEDYARMRDSIYKTVDVVIFCFSLSSIEMAGLSTHVYTKDGSANVKLKGSSSHISLGNIKTVWLPEVEKALGNSEDKKDVKLPIKILVGTKSDQLFENAETRLLTDNEPSGIQSDRKGSAKVDERYFQKQFTKQDKASRAQTVV
jgi:GTPase SAR1 family protein